MWCLLNGYRPPHEPHGYRQSEESWGDDYQAIEEDDDDSDGVGVDNDHSDDDGNDGDDNRCSIPDIDCIFAHSR